MLRGRRSPPREAPPSPRDDKYGADDVDDKPPGADAYDDYDDQDGDDLGGGGGGFQPPPAAGGGWVRRRASGDADGDGCTDCDSLTCAPRHARRVHARI